jgi:phosphoenolpyruvate carboxylase
LRYPTLTLADTYSVIAYYLRHRDEVDAYLEERRRQAEEIRRKVEERYPTAQIRERLLARRTER